MKDALGAVQTLLVVGGGSEIGLATARALVAGRTRTVVLAARDPDRIADAASALEREGATRVERVEFDADDIDGHERFVDRVFDRDEDIDLVLVAFGVLGDEAAMETDADAARSVIETNFVDAVCVMIPLVERLRAQGHGTLVVLSSVAAERPRASNFVYGASKAGLDAFAQGLGDALTGSGVEVMVVRPGFVHTKLTAGRDPAPFSTSPEAVADAIVDGLRRRAHTVWAPPRLRWVMTVVRHLPRPIFRRLVSGR